MRKINLLFLTAALAVCSFAQEPSVGIPAGGGINLPATARSKPTPRGTSLPGTCEVGETYFKTDAAAGQNLYGCTSTNTWTLLGDGGGAGGNHNLLSATHPDTTAASPTRGDLIIANLTPAWTKLALGAATAGKYPKSNGSDVVISDGSASGVGTPTACTNQFITGLTLNADAAPTSTCTTATLASAQFVNQGTTTTVLHGNAAGNPSFAAITSADTTGTFPATAHNLLSATHGDTVGASPVLGDIPYGNVTPAWTKLAGNSTATKNFLTQTGTGAVSAVPAWGTIASGDLPSHTAALATALAANGGNCSANQFNKGVDASGAAESCTALVTADLPAAHVKHAIMLLVGADNGSALADADDQPTLFRFPVASTVTAVWCESDGGSPIVNLQRDDGTPANVLSSNLTCSTSGAAGSIDAAEDNFAAADKLDFVMVTAGGTAKRVSVSVEFTVD